MQQLLPQPLPQTAPQPVQPLRSISEILQAIQKAHSALKNANSDFEERTKKFSGLTSTMTVNFECSLTKETLKYAVFLYECFKTFKHYDGVFDLEQFLKLNYSKLEQQQQKQFSCPICKTVTKFEKIEDAFFPHVIINELRTKCGEFPRQIMYNFIDKTYYPLHKGKMGIAQNSYFEQIGKFMKREIKPENQFYQMVKNFNVNCSFLFYNNCSLSSIKVMIPVRSQQCKHFEVYDLTALLIHFDKKEKQFQCKRPGCNSIIKEEDLILDQDLFNSCLKSYSFRFSFIYNKEKRKLEDILEEKQDINLQKYRKIDQTQEYLNFQSKIYKIVDQIYTSPINQDKTEEFYKKYSLENIKNQNLELKFCQFTDQRIELPCRCIRCEQVQTCDLRYMSCILNQFQNPADIKIGDKVTDKCPLCNNPFTKKIKPKDTPIFEQVYVDVKMMNFFTITTGFANINKKDFINYLQDKVITKVILKKDQESILKGKQAITSMKLECPISKKRITRPIRGNNCTHAQPYDFSILDMHQEGQINLNERNCDICQAKFDYFSEDTFLKDQLDIFYTEQLEECDTVRLNIMNNKISIKPKIL
ncbi:unnamed protein product [Paramecium primaurelia]|uniref:SP-RING-type domain-containing protein n=1 Tax=Paramecium primaurelia TaxID=5886 RepID=A0A8S1M960_PARPR|nr:unnamed protein product [Paramecium primaurelia]